MKRQQYAFQSVWTIARPPETVWEVMTSMPLSWDKWWPQLHDLVVTKAAPGLTGTTFTCNWRAPAGYRLHSSVRVGTVKKQEQVVLHVDGDLHGTLTCVLEETDTGTTVYVDWQVETVKRWMNLWAPVLRPLFIWGHHAVMRSGERGLRRYIAHL